MQELTNVSHTPVFPDVDMEELISTIDSKLSQMDPITLEQMSGIKLMNRIDTKYLVDVRRLPALLDKAKSDYFVQEIAGKRKAFYRTLYWDTADAQMYIIHHDRKLNRQKIRVREYVESNLTFLEIKNKSNKGRTKKIRISVPDENIKSHEDAVDFINKSAKYGIDGKKKWYLFISSFAYCEMDEQQAKMSEAQLGKEDFDAFKDASYKSRDAILDWFEKKLVSCPETLIIYRPHPDETQKCERLKSMAQKYDNFKMVSQEAIKHWVNACDKVYNWFSTGIIDAVVLNKPIRMLRPVEIKEDLDYRLMHNSRKLKNEKEFENDFNNLEIEGKD